MQTLLVDTKTPYGVHSEGASDWPGIMPMSKTSSIRCCRLNRCRVTGRCRLFVVSFVVLFMLHVTLPAQVTQANEVVRFRLRDGYLMIIPVTVNGIGPFNFLLDTGTTRTVIDPDLARQLQAPAIGEAAITTVLHVRQDKLVRLQEVRLGRSFVADLGAVVDALTRQKILAPGIRGVLGEDFLSRFDMLIDFKSRWVRIGDAPPVGERCRFEATGQYNGSPTTNRLLVAVDLVGVSDKTLQLQLDTGAKFPELFPASHSFQAPQSWGGSMATSSGVNDTTIYSNVAVKIGSTTIRGLDVVQSRHSIAFDTVGLLPASLFRRIYISHSGGFVVVNPGY